MKKHKYCKILEEKKCEGKTYKEYLEQYGLHVTKEWWGGTRIKIKKEPLVE